MLAGAPKGLLGVFDLGTKKLQRIVQAHTNGAGVRSVILARDGHTVLTAGGEGCIKTWALDEEGSFTGEEVKGGTIACEAAGALRALAQDEAGAALVAGTARGELWDIGRGKLLMGGHRGACWCVAWHRTVPRVCASGGEDGLVLLWDAEKRAQVASADVQAPVRALDFSPNGQLIAAGLANGGVSVLDVHRFERVAWIQTLKERVTAIRFSPTGRRLAAASADPAVDVYELGAKGLQRLFRFGRHTATVTGLDWSADGALLQSTCVGGEHLCCAAGTKGAQFTEERRDVAWASLTCPLGFGVMGVWPEGYAIGAITTLDVTHTHRFVATGDDRGLVRLLAYPCVAERAPSKQNQGHGSFVGCARFSADDLRLATAGCTDRTLLLWGLDRANDAPPTPKAPPTVPPWEKR